MMHMTRDFKTIFFLILFIPQLSLYSNSRPTAPGVNICKINSKNTKVSQLELNNSKKSIAKNNDHQSIIDRRNKDDAKLNSKKQILSTIHKNTTIYLKSSNIFTYSISYKTWITNEDGSGELTKMKTVVGVKNKTVIIRVDFLSISDLSVHVGLAGQKDTKIRLAQSSLLSNLVDSEFKYNENPQFFLNVSGAITKPNFSLNYLKSSVKFSKISKNAETKVGIFSIESSTTWWGQNSWWTGIIITAITSA